MEQYLKKITKQGKALFLAYDQGLEHGPKDLIGSSIDPNFILDLADKGGATGVILQGGIAEQYYRASSFSQVPLILKINGKSNLYQSEDPYSPITWDINDAKKIGASAIGYTIFLGSAYEYKMFKDFSELRNKAHAMGLAMIAWVYPRGKFIQDEDSEEITAYAARVGLELGADMVKIKYSGSEENFKKAVLAAGKTKVVLSGGSKISEEDFYQVIENVMQAGAIGAAVGRNIWQSEKPLEVMGRITKIIWK